MRKWLIGLLLLASALATGAAPAQVRTVDPNGAIDGDLPPAQRSAPPPRQDDEDVPAGSQDATPVPDDQGPPPPPYQQQAPAGAPYAPATPGEVAANRTTDASQTYHREDLIAAGEGVFGKGAQGLAELIQKILREQGEPNAYIAGREASGAFVLGLRYGSGILTHKVEGQQPIYWTGPSVGFDVGGDASKVFVLVYNLYDTADIYKRFPKGEGNLYFVGGFTASYLRRGNIVLIPIHLGVGWRAGVNVGYMRFSHHTKWLPF